MNVKQSFQSRVIALLVVGLVLAGCSRIPLSSLWALRSLEMAQVEGPALRALLYLPRGIEVSEGGARVTVKVERGQGLPDRIDAELDLVPLQGAAAAHHLGAPRAAGHWVALGLSPEGLRRLAALRQTLARWRSADGPGARRQLGLQADPRLCRRGPAAPDPRLDLWLRWREGQDDLHLLDGATPDDLADAGQVGPLPACG
jgi:hypothetical protein